MPIRSRVSSTAQDRGRRRPDEADREWLDGAFELADRGRGTVSPNPLVGCVLVRHGRVVGEGWHERAGGPHAEVRALEAAGADARGACAYVTLEPCAHHGRTPPCVEALIEAGVARVVHALSDPAPSAGGGGAALQAAGLEVVADVAPDRASRQNEVWLHGVRTGRPFVVLKLATSLDGRIAAADGTARWLTGDAARRRVHALRAEVDAILVGSGTVLADDPHLGVRLPGHEARQPLRVVLDRRGRLDGGGRRWRILDDSGPTVVLDTPDLPGALAELWDREVRSVLVEGGATMAAAFVAAGLVDKVVAHVAPVLLGRDGLAALSLDGPRTLADAPRFRLDTVEQVGEDAVLTLYPTREEPRSPDTPPRHAGLSHE